LAAILDIQNMQYQIFRKFLSHFCTHFDFSLIFQALKPPQNSKSIVFGDFYVKEEEMLFLNVA